MYVSTLHKVKAVVFAAAVIILTGFVTVAVYAEEPDFAIDSEINGEVWARVQSLDVDVVNSPDDRRVIANLNLGQNIEVTGIVDANWYEVDVNGEVGFVESRFLDSRHSEVLPEVEVPEIVTPRGASAVLDTAKSLRGVPYRFGSMDPARGFDCSGFVSYVMSRHDINLNRSSGAMASNGSYISRCGLREGDLVFFATGGGRRISHVGIYVGGGQFIHSETGRGVVITPMSMAYWNSRYVTARRVL